MISGVGFPVDGGAFKMIRAGCEKRELNSQLSVGS